VLMLAATARDSAVPMPQATARDIVVALAGESTTSSEKDTLRFSKASVATAEHPVGWLTQKFDTNYALQRQFVLTTSTVLQIQGTVDVQKDPTEFKRSAEHAAKLRAARAQLGKLSSAIARFKRERNRSPYSLHELTLTYPGRTKGYLKGQQVPLDPWGGRYELRTTRDGATQLVTAGRDGVFGTSDDLHR